MGLFYYTQDDDGVHEETDGTFERLRRTANACHGLDLPSNVEPGILAEVVTRLSDALRLNYDFRKHDQGGNRPSFDAWNEEQGNHWEAVRDILAKLIPVSPPHPAGWESAGDMEPPDICCPESADSAPDFDECCATGQTCEYGPHGLKGESQCEYCGKSAPVSREDQARAKGWTSEFIDGNGVDAELWVSPDKRVASYDLPENL